MNDKEKQMELGDILSDKELKVLMQGLIYLQMAIARGSDATCTELEAENIKCKLYDALQDKR